MLRWRGMVATLPHSSTEHRRLFHSAGRPDGGSLDKKQKSRYDHPTHADMMYYDRGLWDYAQSAVQLTKPRENEH